MKPKSIENCLMKAVKLRKYDNIVEASFLSKFIRHLAGTSVIVLDSTPGDRIVKRFSYFGFICYLTDICIYCYCIYKAHAEDQTILRTIYNTKLDRYGDDVERISSIVFVAFALWKIPFSITGSSDLYQLIVDIDKAIERMGEIVDQNKCAFYALLITIGQILEYSFRLACIWMALESLGVKVPMEKLYQLVYTDTLSLVLVSHYCFLLCVLRSRYKYLNKILVEIQQRKAWEYKIFTRTKLAWNADKVGNIQERNICEKISSVAKVYSMLYRATNIMNKLFGTALLMAMLGSLICIILYLFYFMEATASGLFTDVRRYIDFLVCVFWQIAHAVSIMFALVYFSESTVHEALKTACISHSIMQEDFSANINTEAMQLSMQILHQTPKFTANGLIALNYALLYEGARSVFTYLIIVLQFATDS